MPAPSSPPTRVRQRVVLVTALMAILLYLDRFCISFAEVFIKEDLRLSDTQISWVLSAFFWTYALGQVPSGWLSDRYGARIMLAIYVLLWSLFTGLTGFAQGLVVLLALRLGFGLAQAGAYPTSAGLISKWIPFSGRGMASSIVAVGGRLGGALAPLLTALLIVLLVPVNVPSRVNSYDLLNAPRLCHEFLHGSVHKESDDIKLRVGAQVVGKLPMDTRQTVRRLAADYTLALRAARNRAIARRQDPAKIAPPVLQASAADLENLAAGLNQILRLRGFFQRDGLMDVSLPAEASKLMSADQGLLTSPQIERLNRLVLETVYPESIKKVYGAGWRPAMLLFGVVGLLVAGLYWYVVRDRPSRHPHCNNAELALIEGGRPPEAPQPYGRVGAVPLRRLLTSRSILLFCVWAWFTNVGWVFLVTWLPRYLHQIHHVPVQQRGLMAFIPLAVGWFGMVTGGRLTDLLVRKVGLRWGRALPMALSRFTAMAAYLFCLFQPSPWTATAAFAVVAFSTDLGTGASWAFNQDVGGRYVGSVLGWGNMWGNLGAAVTPTLLIWIVGEQQNWNAAFLTCAVAFLISGLAALGIDASVPIDSD